MQRIKYITENANDEKVEYAFHNPSISRFKAIEQLKLFRAESNSFDRLKLSYAICDDDFPIETIPLINGREMCNSEVLEALNIEFDILSEMDYELPYCKIESEGKIYTMISPSTDFLLHFAVGGLV